MSNRIKNNLKNLVGQTLNQYYSKVKPTISDLKYKQEYQNRIIECMVGEVDDNYIETPETDAPIVKLEHSKEGLVKVPSIKGKTILVDEDGNETDTPGEGCRLVSVGEDEDNKLIILSKNKNLFDENELKQEPISTDFSYVNQDNKRCIKNNVKGWRYLKILNNKFKENTIYRIIYCAKNTDVTNNGTGAYFTLEYTDGTTSHLYTNNLNGQWFEVSGYSVQGKTIKCVNFSNAGNCITYIDLDSIIITEGTEKVEYIPSKQHKTEILLNEPLRKYDYMLDNKIYRKCKNLQIEPNFKIYSQQIWNDYYGVYMGINGDFSDIVPSRISGETVYFSRFIINYNRWDIVSDYGIQAMNMYILSSNLSKYLQLFCKIPKNEVELYNGTIDEKIQQWFNDNAPKLDIIYEIENPIIEELPNGITLQCFDDTTMYIENSITPTVQYGYNALIPYKQELLNQKEEVETNTLDIEQNIIPYLMDMEFNLMLMEDK